MFNQLNIIHMILLNTLTSLVFLNSITSEVVYKKLLYKSSNLTYLNDQNHIVKNVIIYS